jgi:hypothetical protein
LFGRHGIAALFKRGAAMNAMRKTDSLTGAVHSSMGGIHLVRPDLVRPDVVRPDVVRLDAAQNVLVAAVPGKPAAAGKPAPCGTGLAAERITAAVLLVMCIAAAVFV